MKKHYIMELREIPKIFTISLSIAEENKGDSNDNDIDDDYDGIEAADEEKDEEGTDDIIIVMAADTASQLQLCITSSKGVIHFCMFISILNSIPEKIK